MSKRAVPPIRRRSALLLPAALLVLSGTGPVTLAWAQEEPPLLPQTSEPAPPVFGAISFTADGSFSSAWKLGSRAEAEAKVRGDCVRFRRGPCQVVSFRGELCAAIASFKFGRDRKVTYAGGGVTRKDAKRSALERCNDDSRARNRCKLRMVVCGDGR